MSKSFEEQIRIVERDSGLSRKDAKELMIAFNAFDENQEGKMVVSSDFAWLIGYYRNKKGFDVLKEISVREMKTCFELGYSLLSTESNNEVTFYIVIKNKNQSISHFYENASELEEELDEKYDILFYNFD